MPTSRPASRRNRTLGLLVLVPVIAVGGAFAYQSFTPGAIDDSLTWTTKREELRITVTERGTLESQKTISGVCQLGGYENKIIFIVEEGTTVKEGDVVVRFDSSEIDEEIAEEQIEVNQAKAKVESSRQEVEVQRNTGQSEVAAAELELTLAVLDLEKYEQGDYQVSLNDLQGKIAVVLVAVGSAIFR